MREIKPCFIGIYQGPFLLHMIAQDLAKRFMQEMSSAMIAHCFSSNRTINSGMNEISDL